MHVCVYRYTRVCTVPVCCFSMVLDVYKCDRALTSAHRWLTLDTEWAQCSASVCVLFSDLGKMIVKWVKGPGTFINVFFPVPALAGLGTQWLSLIALLCTEETPSPLHLGVALFHFKTWDVTTSLSWGFLKYILSGWRSTTGGRNKHLACTQTAFHCPCKLLRWYPI